MQRRADTASIVVPNLRRRGTRDPESPHQAAQGARTQPENACCARPPLYPSAGTGQYALDVIPFDVNEHPRLLADWWWVTPLFHEGRQSGQLELAIPGQNDRLLKYVLELADVSRPVVLLEQMQGVGADVIDRLSELTAEPAHQVRHEERQVLTPLAQRGQRNGK